MSLVSGVTYCNFRCGRCNRDRELYKMGYPSCLDDKPATYKYLNLFKIHRSSMIPTRDHVQRCSARNDHKAWHKVSSPVGTCSRGGRAAELCGRDFYPVMLDGRVYRNLFCVFCNVSTLTYQIIVPDDYYLEDLFLRGMGFQRGTNFFLF